MSAYFMTVRTSCVADRKAENRYIRLEEAAVPDCAQVGLIKYFVSLQAVDFYALIVRYRYACVVLVESQI